MYVGKQADLKCGVIIVGISSLRWLRFITTDAVVTGDRKVFHDDISTVNTTEPKRTKSVNQMAQAAAQDNLVYLYRLQ